MDALAAPTLDEVREARQRIRPYVLPIPLVPLDAENAPQPTWLQLENLQVVGSYKLRGVANVILQTDPGVLARGVATVSAGNLGQGIAWFARKLGFPCRVFVPDHAPAAKVAALQRYGAEVIRISLDEWWEIMRSGQLPDYPGLFVHGVFNRDVMAGHGTIALDILDALPDVDSVIIPFGGGAMTCGIAAALKAIRPAAHVYTCEVETGAPLKAALVSRGPVEVDYRPSFVDGIGSRSVFPQMWPVLEPVVTDSIVVSLQEVRDAIRMLASRHHVIAEGAGAAALAAALAGQAALGKTACIISGGHIDVAVLADIFCPGREAAAVH